MGVFTEEVRSNLRSISEAQSNREQEEAALLKRLETAADLAARVSVEFHHLELALQGFRHNTSRESWRAALGDKAFMALEYFLAKRSKDLSGAFPKELRNFKKRLETALGKR